jgi:hypothetical protein
VGVAAAAQRRRSVFLLGACEREQVIHKPEPLGRKIDFQFAMANL